MIFYFMLFFFVSVSRLKLHVLACLVYTFFSLRVTTFFSLIGQDWSVVCHFYVILSVVKWNVEFLIRQRKKKERKKLISFISV